MISQSRYIRITSGVGAGAAVAERKLILRLLSPSSTLPSGVVAEFDSDTAVGAYFGLTSDEYKRAVRYFGFISKQINSPQTLSFSRFIDTNIPAQVVGDTTTKVLASLKALSNAVLTIVYDSTPYVTDAIDLSAAVSFTDIATALETGIQGSASVADVPALAGATVVWNGNTNQFILTAAVSTAGSGTMSVTNTGNVGDPAVLLGWGTAGTVNAPGASADDAISAITRSESISNNFGTFIYMTDLTDDDIVAVAQWNDAKNNMYMFLASRNETEIGVTAPLVKGYSGTGLMVRSSILPDDYVDQCPAELLAATNYDQANAVQNFMYYQYADRNIVVTSDPSADYYDGLRVNYIGATQQAGQQLAFFQRGVLMGGPQDAVDMNTYANEMWFKSAIISKLFEMFLNLGRVPANEDGAATIQAMIQVVIDNAKVNGVISVGKALTEVQKQYINQTTRDNTAWRQIQTIGYWLTVDFEQETTSDDRIETYATYTLLYSKDDAVRRVEGRDILI